MLRLRQRLYCAATMLGATPGNAVSGSPAMHKADPAKMKEWRKRWEKNITNDSRNRYCDKSNGEEIGWFMSPFLEGFYYGYLATGDPKWIDMLVDWTDAWAKRAVKEPDGYPGWPCAKAAGTDVDDLDRFDADSMLGEAMALRPVTLMAAEVLKTPALRAKYGAKAERYLELSEQIYQKWDRRGGWRETKGDGMISVVLPYGIDSKKGKWIGYATRNSPGNGFSHPNNKANCVARWVLALYDATQKPGYRERAEKWFRVMKSRMHPAANGTYKIWNYWEPAGPWDYKPNGTPKHWVGVHPNAGYYVIDTDGIVDAYQHRLVFDRGDMDRLIATSLVEKRYWPALAPYNAEIQAHCEAGLTPDNWGGLSTVPKYLSLQPSAK